MGIIVIISLLITSTTVVWATDRSLVLVDSLNVRRIGSYNTPGKAKSIAVNGSYAYLANYTKGLRIISIADPEDPVEISFNDSLGWAYDVAVSNSHAYVATDDGLSVISLIPPTNPIEVGSYEIPDDGKAQAVALDGNYAYIGDNWEYNPPTYLRALSVVNPQNPVHVGSLYVALTSGVDDIAIDESYAHLAAGGYLIISISSPANMEIIGSYPASGDIEGVAVINHHAYIADGPRGLRVISFASPRNPIEISSFNTPGNATKIAISGSLAYIADEGAGVRIVSIIDPELLYEVGYYDTPDKALDIAVDDSYIYVADEDSGLLVLEYFGPTSIGNPEDEEIYFPKTFTLSQNYPNPFNPSTTIQYDVPERQPSIHVEISVYDVRGRLIEKLVDEKKEPGSYSVNWDGRDSTGHRVSSGIYLYRMQIDRDFVSTKKMVLLK